MHGKVKYLGSLGHLFFCVKKPQSSSVSVALNIACAAHGVRVSLCWLEILLSPTGNLKHERSEIQG